MRSRARARFLMRDSIPKIEAAAREIVKREGGHVVAPAAVPLTL